MVYNCNFIPASDSLPPQLDREMGNAQRYRDLQPENSDFDPDSSDSSDSFSGVF